MMMGMQYDDKNIWPEVPMLETRRGRDQLRIWMLEKAGYNVFTVGLGNHNEPKHANHLDADFGNIGTTVRRNYVGALQRHLGAHKLDLIFDEWLYMPVDGYKCANAAHHFYHRNKYFNLCTAAKNGLLNPGCRIFVPLNLDAVLNIYGDHSDSIRLWKEIETTFTVTYLKGDTECKANHPLWMMMRDKSRFPTGLPEKHKDFLVNLTLHEIESTRLSSETRGLMGGAGLQGGAEAAVIGQFFLCLQWGKPSANAPVPIPRNFVGKQKKAPPQAKKFSPYPVPATAKGKLPVAPISPLPLPVPPLSLPQHATSSSALLPAPPAQQMALPVPPPAPRGGHAPTKVFYAKLEVSEDVAAFLRGSTNQ